MLKGSQIPQNDDRPEHWPRFLEKASKGSIKAYDMLTHADMAYMVALTGDTNSPNTLLLAEYGMLVEQFIASQDRPMTPSDLLTTAVDAGWFKFNQHLRSSSFNSKAQYGSLWSRKHRVTEGELIHDALHHCCAQWSRTWLREVVDEENELTYNSLDVVAAMLMLAATWKAE